MDPYWGGLWNVSGTAYWSSRDQVERQAEQGLLRAPGWCDRSVEEWCDEIAFGRNREVLLRALAAVNLWRTVTSEQLGVITGSNLFTSVRAPGLQALYGSGLVQRGQTVHAGFEGRFPDLLRPANTGDLGVLRERLTRNQMSCLTSGEWKLGLAADRHNVLATELLLRIAERVPLVLGEAVCEHRRLFPNLAPKSWQSAGDGMFIRPDGHRVVIELTASVSSNFASKAEKWVRLLAGDPDRGTSVLFVEAAHPDRASFGVKAVRKVVTEAIDGVPGSGLSQVSQRVMVARWSDWFPAPGEESDDFVALKAYRPTGDSDGVWEPVELLDPYELTEPPTNFKDVFGNVDWLWGVPHWQRCGTIPVI